MPESDRKKLLPYLFKILKIKVILDTKLCNSGMKSNSYDTKCQGYKNVYQNFKKDIPDHVIEKDIMKKDSQNCE